MILVARDKNGKGYPKNPKPKNQVIKVKTITETERGQGNG